MISRLPEDTGMDEILYRLHVLYKIRKGREDVEKDQATSSEKMRSEMEAW